LAGACADYVRNTVAHLREMGIREPELERLVAELEARADADA
jgi:cation transport regulator ChaC